LALGLFASTSVASIPFQRSKSSVIPSETICWNERMPLASIFLRSAAHRLTRATVALGANFRSIVSPL